ncbi:hypothetical protein Tco_1433808 [Tanacetum coccineum]
MVVFVEIQRIVIVIVVVESIVVVIIVVESIVLAHFFDIRDFGISCSVVGFKEKIVVAKFVHVSFVAYNIAYQKEDIVGVARKKLSFVTMV